MSGDRTHEEHAASVRRQIASRLEDLRADGLWAMPRRESGRLFESQPEPGEGAPEPLSEVEAEALACTRCKLHEGRTKVVFGDGDPRADVMFIGEGPGRDEDLQGLPFVGRAGQLLDRIIEAMQLSRKSVYIANAVKCRPPNNRNPEADELEACRPYLLRQVACVRPRVIVLLGRVAVLTVLGYDTALSRLRGRFHDWNGIPVMCTYHPAYLLRNPSAKRMVWEDIQQVMALLAERSA